MSKHFQRELDLLQKKLQSLAALAEEQVVIAVGSIEKKDAVSARRVIDFDRHIDLLEIEIEEDCLKMLALHQPVATDLRFIVAVLKINNDLERIADLASNIAERAIVLATIPSFSFDSKLSLMCSKALAMVRQCLDAFFTMNDESAHTVCRADDEVDALNRQMVDAVKTAVKENNGRIGEYLMFLSVAQNIERIADHATNIAEDVIYMIEGEIVRHRVD